MRSDELLEVDDLDGYAVFKRVARAAGELLFKKLPLGRRCSRETDPLDNKQIWFPPVSARAALAAFENLVS